MALIVETGAGLPDAESFCSVTAATTYHANRGNAAWAALANDTVREQCLRRATDYMEQMYRPAWAGWRHTDTQALSWPRDEVPFQDAPGGYGTFPAYYPNDEVPAAVVNACAELALKAATQPLAPDQGRETKREKVGEIEVEYMDRALPFVRYTAIDRMLAPFLSGLSGGAKVVRT